MRLSFIKEAAYIRINLLLKQLNSRSPQPTQQQSGNPSLQEPQNPTLPLNKGIETEINNVS